ncbi:hypothetical protein QNA08_16815 [Chelatococcus sp. SYSU_G07232]|uniref:Uncharacterized protein n=1 Tax=Chelatococcus albus TaxID=3047466 RepID=A0ABT7AMU9_9HYPH|nr:hypothetical protein [Chelatococcus sp. SYSU_G07232]MDJ1159881.1 hypothetical protein [Chelatococcus sp. SYSU_G07232]
MNTMSARAIRCDLLCRVYAAAFRRLAEFAVYSEAVDEQALCDIEMAALDEAMAAERGELQADIEGNEAERLVAEAAQVARDDFARMRQFRLPKH